MDTLSAYLMGQANRGQPLKVFDWDEAARLIREHEPDVASAGLAGDWSCTGDVIYSDGEPQLDAATFLSSNWATPTLVLDGDEHDCYVMESETDWDSGTVWPPSALAILRGSK